MIIKEITKPNHLRANSKKPKMVKPNKGHMSPNVNRGKLVGEGDLVKGKFPEKKPRQSELPFDYNQSGNDINTAPLEKVRYEVWAEVPTQPGSSGMTTYKFADFRGPKGYELAVAKANRMIKDPTGKIPPKMIRILKLNHKTPLTHDWNVQSTRGQRVTVPELQIS